MSHGLILGLSAALSERYFRLHEERANETTRPNGFCPHRVDKG